MKKVERYVDAAARAAEHSMSTFRVGAAVIMGSQVILAVPNVSYGPTGLHGRYTLHAEAHAIMLANNLGIPLRECTLCVVRLGNGGETRMAKPCEGCAKLVCKNGIRKVYYSTGESTVSYTEEITLNNYRDRCIPRRKR